MTAPDLSTDEGRAAYRRELRRVAWPVRTAGFAMILAGAGVIGATRLGWIASAQPIITASYGAIAFGWALFFAAIFMRTRHHRLRMAELQEAAR